MTQLVTNYLQIWSRLWSFSVEIAREMAYALPAVAMVFVSIVPAPALAFVADRESSHRPLRFVHDASLNSRAILGIEAFPAGGNNLVGFILRSRIYHIPEAVGPLQPGVSVLVLATAYSSTGDQTDASPYTTAAGTQVAPGTIAANFLPFGTRVRIGGNEYTVLDRMNERYDNKYIIDLWFQTREEAVQFGVQQLELEIIALPAFE